MPPLGLTYAEFRTICGAFEGILVEEGAPCFDFRGLLVQWLREYAPDLAGKVQQFDDEQILFLYKEVAVYQRLRRWVNE
jgi:hypothetical protein